ncbi:CHRD domain-containing protein [Variovorax sp. LT1R16]|uniref:CHRD domain-containing protein n=1 Tax=Variovorax sp. LT1R16 TaxID=3443728 RepID=UPI003F4892ED
MTLGRRFLLFGAALAALVASGCGRIVRAEPSALATEPARGDAPEWLTVDCSLEPGDVVPSRAGNAGGSMSGTLTLNTGDFRWRLNYARLSGPATLAGFYGPAAPGSNGPLAIQLPPHSQAVQHNPGPDAGYELTGHSRLTPTQVAEVRAGLWYVSVSTRAWPAGEVRGQMKRSTFGAHGV